MTTTDTDALQERIAEELYYDQRPEGRHRNEWPTAVYSDTVYECRDLAAAVLPIIAAEVRAAKAAAWDEGCAAAEQYYKRTAIGAPGSDPIPAPLNPHRETGGRT